MTGKKRKRGITPWKKTALKVCVLWLLIAAGIHGFRLIKAYGFEDQREASRWGAAQNCAQVSAFLPTQEAMKEEEILELEYKINSSLAQDSIKLTAEGEDARLWQDCYSGIGSLTLAAGSKTVTVEAVGTGGAFFTFHPLELSAGSYYLPDSIMKDEILLDQETAWKLFGAFDVEGRTVRVQDMYLRIAGVYKKEQGGLYQKAGLADYVVFVQYKTLLQYGGSGSGSDRTDQTEAAAGFIPASAARPAAGFTPASAASAAAGFIPASVASAAEDLSLVSDPSGSEKEAGTAMAYASEDEAPPEADSGEETGSGTESGAGSESGSGGESHSESTAGSGTSESGDSSQSGNGDEQGAFPEDTQNTENVGTTNTNYKDTGMITSYEIVMPDPVEGYAAAVLSKALGEDSGAIIVDNTNRFGVRSLVEDIREFALLGMRTRNVRYPYWENVAMGWETIFAALFLLECILIILTILLLVWMVLHWYRNKSWTLAGSIQNMQDSVYERQSRKRYPEYYREKEQSDDVSGEEPGREEPAASAAEPANTSKAPAGAGDNKERGRLEDKGLTPFERIPENRKAVEYETNYQDDQRGDGSGAGSDNDGMRRRKQQ